MKVDPEDWPILSELMDKWLDLPADQREAWLDDLQTSHADLLPVLRELLAQPRPGFLETLPRMHVPETNAKSAGALFVPDMLAGPYRLLHELGRGGMGVVWLAVRADNTIKREVALKFPLLYGPMLVDRFFRERDILARLTDPRIARLYDAGVTTQGQPYFGRDPRPQSVWLPWCNFRNAFKWSAK